MKMKLIAVLFAVLMVSVLVPKDMFCALPVCTETLIEQREPCLPSSGSGNMGEVITTVNDVWGSVILIVQVTSVACVVFAGVRYMFASADKKADIKKGLLYLAIGAVLVFAATTVISFVFGIGKSIIGS